MFGNCSLLLEILSFCQSQERLKPKRCLVGFIFTLKKKQAGAELCQAQFKLGLSKTINNKTVTRLIYYYVTVVLGWFCLEKQIGWQKLWLKKLTLNFFGVNKILGWKIIWVEKEFESENMFCRTKFWVEKNIGWKKNLGRKLLSRKKLGWK